MQYLYGNSFYNSGSILVLELPQKLTCILKKKVLFRKRGKNDVNTTG